MAMGGFPAGAIKNWQVSLDILATHIHQSLRADVVATCSRGPPVDVPQMAAEEIHQGIGAWVQTVSDSVGKLKHGLLTGRIRYSMFMYFHVYPKFIQVTGNIRQ